MKECVCSGVRSPDDSVAPCIIGLVTLPFCARDVIPSAGAGAGAGHSSSSQCFCQWIFWGSWKYENPTIEHSSGKWKFLLDKLCILKCAVCAQVQLPARWCGIFESWFLEFINHASTAVKISHPLILRGGAKQIMSIEITVYSTFSGCKFPRPMLPTCFM